MGSTRKHAKMSIVGMVGMPNVGKRTTFNLLSNQHLHAENYPFYTILPNKAIVKVPDE
jgi:ribosome-binding ATPase YchF (GTP1/OBG family)